jgi:hypothetical protein
VPPPSLPPAILWCLNHGATTGENPKALFESYLLAFRSTSTSSNGILPSVVRIFKPAFGELVNCILSFRGRPPKVLMRKRLGRRCFYSRAWFAPHGGFHLCGAPAP